MNRVRLSELLERGEWVGLGLAGNQAGHLSEAGEDSDFSSVVAEENAPKGIFPWYLPNNEGVLGVDPLSSNYLELCGGDDIQPEAEVALVVEFDYSDSPQKLLSGIKVLAFGAFNDCSRRISAPKISLKKNWGVNTKGVSESFVKISDFDLSDGFINKYRLVSYLRRGGQLHQYGVDTPVSDYCYFNEQLSDWMVRQINVQADEGPLEDVSALLDVDRPSFGVIGIGATCYTDFGNSDNRFLIEGDSTIVCLYDADVLSLLEVEKILSEGGAKEYPALIYLEQVVR